ncbi:MAG: type II CAAX endopeptidase family protein [Chthonomonadales bacterium]
MTEPDSNSDLIPDPGVNYRWKWGLVAVVILLCASSFFNMRTGRGKTVNDATKLYLDVSIESRQVYSLQEYSPNSASGKQIARKLVTNLQEINSITHSANSTRVLAIIQNFLKDPAWQKTLVGLRTSKPRIDDKPLTAAQIESEISMWKAIFTGKTASEQASTYAKLIRTMDLGWHEHLALLALYKSSGQKNLAEEQSDILHSSTIRMGIIGILMILVGLVGLGMGILLVAFVAWRRKHPHVRIQPEILNMYDIRPAEALQPVQARVLYSIFVIYLCSMAGIRLLMTGIQSQGWLDFMKSMSPASRMSISILLAFVTTIPPLLLFLRFRRQGVVSWNDIGFKRGQTIGDIVWGICGYFAALPVIIIVTLIATQVFKHFTSPVNPAVTDALNSHNMLILFLTLCEASLMAPLIEETMFRGVFLNALHPSLGRVGSSLTSAGVFAILHPQLPAGFFSIFTIGLLFNTLYRNRNSLLPGMVAHAINNGSIVLMLSLMLAD